MYNRIAHLGMVAGLGLVMGSTGCAALLSSPQSGNRLHVKVPKAPPAPKAEQAPAKVKPGQFWVKGYWDYDKGSKPSLEKLYEKAKTGQWNATTDLPWDHEVDLEQVVSADQAAISSTGVAASRSQTEGSAVEPHGDGSDIERDDLVYSVNEWDNYAVEEAIQIVERVGGSVTVVSVDDSDAEETVHREMAMGADKGILLSDDAFEGADGRGIAPVPDVRTHQGGGRRDGGGRTAAPPPPPAPAVPGCR